MQIRPILNETYFNSVTKSKRILFSCKAMPDGRDKLPEKNRSIDNLFCTQHGCNKLDKWSKTPIFKAYSKISEVWGSYHSSTEEPPPPNIFTILDNFVPSKI